MHRNGNQGNGLLTGQDFRQGIAILAGPFPLGLDTHRAAGFPARQVQGRRRRYRQISGRVARPRPAMLHGKGPIPNPMQLVRNAPMLPGALPELLNRQPAAAHLIVLLRRPAPGLPFITDLGHAA